MEKELPSKFASLTGEKLPNAEPKLEKREKPDTKIEEQKVIPKDNSNGTQEQKTDSKEEKGGILDRIKPRPNNNNKVKKTKETTEGVPDQPQNEAEEGAEKPKRDPAKTRCNFWPSCKTTDCPFVHPNQQVS